MTNVIPNNNNREATKQTPQKKSFFNFHFALRRGPGRYPLDPYLNKGILRISRRNGVGYIAKQKYARISGFASLSILIILLTLAVYPIILHDSSAEAMGTALPSTTSLTMTTGQTSANLDITPRDSAGTFASSSSSDQASFRVTTNNYTGYTLTISGSNDTKQLTNTAASSVLDSIPSAIDENTFNVSTSFNGKGGYQPSKYNSEVNTNFLPAPTTTAVTLDETSAPNPTTANEYTIGLGARIDYNSPAGTYTNTFILNAVGNPALYVIDYQDVTGDTSVANLPAGASSSTSATTVVLSSQEPTRNGYTFAGWCDGTVNTTGTNPGTICTGTTYTAGAEFGVDQTSTNSATLYAVWTPIAYTMTINFAGYPATSVQVRTASGTGGSLIGTVSTSGGTVSGLDYNNTYYLYPVGTNWNIYGWTNNDAGTLTCAGDDCSTDANPTFTIGLGDADVTVTGKPTYMQDLSKSMCQTLATDAALSVKDSRDNQDYTVRYIGGTCWMTKNLMFGYNSSNPATASLTLTPATSNVTSNRTVTVYDLVTKGTSGNECYGTYNSTTQIGSGPGYVNACIHSGSNDYTDGNTVWYNYAAATAGTIVNKSDTDTTGNLNTATESICPKGWTLPTTKQINNISGGTSGSATYISVFNPVLGGYYGRSTLYHESDRGFWYGSEMYNGIRRYYLYYDDNNLSISGGGQRHEGLYIRCVSEEKTVADLTYMQDMTSAISDWTPEGTTAQLTDRRDGKLYNVAKINGNMWMTQNLRLGYDSTNGSGNATAGVATITLTEDDSNITFTTAEASAGKRVLTTYDLVTYGKNTTGSNQCWGTYNSTTQTGWGPGYQNSCIHSGSIATSGDLPTVWYNYTLATAGTIIDENTSSSSPATNTTTATESICPKGWTLPSQSQNLTIGTTFANNPDPAYVGIFSPVLGGDFHAGIIYTETTRGSWWSSVAHLDALRHVLRFTGIGLYNGNLYREYGVYIRCIQAS